MLTSNETEYEVVAKSAEELAEEGIDAKEGHIYLKMKTPDPAIEQGASGSVHVILEESLSTLWVPAKAVREIRGKHVVYCLNEDGFREMREVTLGVQNGKITEILTGVEENEIIVVD